MLLDKTEIMARVAFRRALQNAEVRQGQITLPEHVIEEARYYAELGIGVLRERSTHDPDEHAPTLAEMAIIEYAKLMILGKDPDRQGEFLMLFRQWERGSSVQKYRDAPDDPDTDLGRARRTRRHATRRHRLRDPATGEAVPLPPLGSDNAPDGNAPA